MVPDGRDAQAPVGYTEALGFTSRANTRGLEPMAAHLNDDASRDQFALGCALARSIGGDPHRRSRCKMRRRWVSRWRSGLELPPKMASNTLQLHCAG
jgi:hypothetical protein